MSSKRITTTELYKSIIEIQTEMRLIGQNQGLSKTHFTRLVYLILASVFGDIIIHFILWSLK